jgi:branched-chain amino acid transport system substrate-binding protein
MDRRKFLKVSGGIAGAGVVAGCSGDGGSGGDGGGGDGGSGGDGGGGSGEPVHIGGLEPLSGPFTPWGQAHVSGIEYAIEEINSNGGVLDGRELEFHSEDTASSPSEADSIFRRMVEQEGIVAATGPVSSDVGVRTAQTAQNIETPLFFHMSGSNEAITESTNHAYRVGLLPATNIIRSQAQLVGDRDIQKVGAIVGDYAWGRSIQEAINNEFPVDVQIEVAPVGASDFKSQLRRFDSDLDMFIATGHPPGQLTITQQLFDLGISADFITGSGYPLSVLVDALGDNATEGVVMYHLNGLENDAFQEVAQAYGEETGQYFGPNVSYGYTTGKLIAHAIEEAGEASASAINGVMGDISFDTIYSNPIQYQNNGELHNQINNFSRIELEAPDYAADANSALSQFFQSEPLPAIPASE